jgi:hypothetical protein
MSRSPRRVALAGRSQLTVLVTLSIDDSSVTLQRETVWSQELNVGSGAWRQRRV